MQTNMSSVPRRSERRPATIPIRPVLEVENFNADDSAITTDTSTYGVGVRTTLPLFAGEWVGYIVKGKFPYAIPTRVAWAKRDHNSGWMYAGLEFTDKLTKKMAA